MGNQRGGIKRKTSGMKINVVAFGVLVAFFMAVSIGLISGCDKRKVAGYQELPDQDDVLEFDVFRVEKREIKRDVDGLGSLIVYDKATVLSRIDGIVEKVLVKKGDMVRKGDELIFLSNYQLGLDKIRVEKEVLEAEEELETAKMQYMDEEKNLYKKFFEIEKMELEIRHYGEEIRFLEDNLKRKRILYEKGGMTEEELRNLIFSIESKKRELGILQKEYEIECYGFRDKDLVEEGYSIPSDEEELRKLIVYINTKLLRKRIEFAEIELKKAQIELERVNWLLENSTIRSPVEGIVTEVTKYVGEKVAADEAVTTIINQENLIARVSFSEVHLPLIKPDSEVFVYIDSLNRELRGRVYTIDPYIDSNTRSFSVDCLIRGSRNMVPGMFVRVRIPVKRVEKLLLIPRSALMEDGEHQGWIYVVSRNDRIFRRKVYFEPYEGEYFIIRDGLEEGDFILRKPLLNLVDGTRIIRGSGDEG
ncbi:MAG: efflux RND transporter periplasmic adaptor subunit [Spirochaetota bacterium]